MCLLRVISGLGARNRDVDPSTKNLQQQLDPQGPSRHEI
jgi:hypothetical protein